MAKLLMISGDRSLVRGKTGAFYNTLEEFHKYWDRIDIICPKTTNRQPSTTNYFGNVFIHPSPWPLIFQPWWILREGSHVLRANNYKPETRSYLMTVHEYPPFYNGIGARLLWNKTHTTYVLEILHIPGHPKAANLKEKLYRSLLKFFIKYDSARAKAIRVINKKQTPGFLTGAGIPEKKLLYIPAFYVDLDIFRPMNLPKEYDLIFVGRLAENKGINLFLEAVRKLNCRAVIVGEGFLENRCKLKIENWKLKIDMHGWAKDSQEVSGLINKSKILVMPSYNEGGPRVVLEAMACGVPVITTRVGLMPDIIKDGENGLFTGWDAEGMAEKISKLLGDKILQDKFRIAGLELVKQFEKKEAIKNYADKLKELINP